MQCQPCNRCPRHDPGPVTGCGTPRPSHSGTPSAPLPALYGWGAAAKAAGSPPLALRTRRAGRGGAGLRLLSAGGNRSGTSRAAGQYHSAAPGGAGKGRGDFTPWCCSCVPCEDPSYRRGGREVAARPRRTKPAPEAGHQAAEPARTWRRRPSPGFSAQPRPPPPATPRGRDPATQRGGPRWPGHLAVGSGARSSPAS